MFISAPEKRARIVNRGDLATLCGFSLPTVDAWVRKGCPIERRGSKGVGAKFDFSAVVEWRVAQAVEAATVGLRDPDGHVSKDEADRRRAVAQAVMAEIEADEALSGVITRQDAEGIISDFTGVIRSALGMVAGAVAVRIAETRDPNAIRDQIAGAINDAFMAAETAFANMEPTHETA